MKSQFPVLTATLLVLVAIAFALQNFFDLSSFAFTPAYAFSRPWTFVTAIFLHANIIHIFFNSFALLIFGTFLEARISKAAFVLIFFLGGVLGNIGYMLTSTDAFTPAIGASGAIYGIMGAVAILAPTATVFVYGIPMPMILALLVWGALEVFGVFIPQGNIASIAHVFGLVSGVLFALYMRNGYNRKAKLLFEDS